MNLQDVISMSGTTASTSSIDPVESNPPKIRLEYLDGLRGFAALAVLFYHICAEMNWRRQGLELPPIALRLLESSWCGRFAVAIFIVLSGYCLMLPVVRSKNGQLPGGWLNYFKRRGRRILPPYYAALIFSVLLFVLIPKEVGFTMGKHWNDALPVFTPGTLISHVLLLHNLKYDWVYKINGVMWSVATEWQIYFFFPLLLLPVWRLFGIIPTVATAFTVGLTPHYLLHGYLDWAVPWYLGLFALGMAGVVVGFSQKPSLIFCRERLPWAVIGLGTITILIVQQRRWENYHAWIIDALVGAIAACLLIYCTQSLTKAEKNRKPPLILQVLDSPVSVALGVFSYSLYLIHPAVLGLTQLLVNNLPVSPLAKILVLPILAVPLALLLSYLFHLAIERRFMRHTHPTKEPAIQ